MFSHSACSRNDRGGSADNFRLGTGGADLAVVEAAVAEALAVRVAELRARTRRAAPVAFARQTAIYLAHTVVGLNYSAIARAMGRDRTTVAHACRVLEQRRDDPAIDAIVARLERAIGVCLYESAPRQRRLR